MDPNWDSEDCGLFCGNCCKPMKEESTTTLKVQSSLGIFIEAVQIIDAIEYIYGISWNEFLSYLDKCVDNSSKTFITDAIHICQFCLPLLSETYSAYKRFENESHSSSIVQKINSFRLQQNIPTRKEKEMVFDPHFECGYRDGEDLVNSYNFEDNLIETAAVEVDLEEKYVVSDNDGPSQKSPEKSLNSYSEKRITRGNSSSMLNQEVVIKLERLFNEDLRGLKKAKDTSARKKVSSSATRTRNTKKSSKVRAATEKNCNANGNDIKFEGYLREIKKRRRNVKGCKVTCKICGMKLKDFGHYKYKHLPKHFGKREKQCEICKKVFNEPNSLIYHMKVVHADEEQKKKVNVTCEICDAKMTIFSLKLHMKTMHSGPRETHKCNICDKEYLSKKVYEDHLLTHSKDFTPYLCGQCGKSCNSAKVLASHERRHSGIKKFSCKECPQTYFTPNELKRHEECHVTERKYICEECGKTFNVKINFQRHLKKHNEVAKNGEMKLKCKECDKLFLHSTSLYKHNVRFHRPDLKKKIYKCSFCHKILCSQTNLTIHENLHKNNPGYQPRRKQTWKNKYNQTLRNLTPIVSS